MQQMHERLDKMLSALDRMERALEELLMQQEDFNLRLHLLEHRVPGVTSTQPPLRPIRTDRVQDTPSVVKKD